jgi:nitrogen-specific signal transduction histidine kinase
MDDDNRASIESVNAFKPAAARVAASVLEEERRLLAADPLLGQMLAAYPGAVLVLNASRQIVAANAAATQALGGRTLLGSRFGEALGCIHAHEAPDGCGTTPACWFCGAGAAMSAFELTGGPARQDCRISVNGGQGPSACDLRVWTRAIEAGEQTFMLVVFEDVSAEKRRDVLERLFFHDALNTAAGIKGALDLWSMLSADEAGVMRLRMKALSAQLIEEIQAQRDLTEAERGELRPVARDVEVGAVMEQLRTLYSGSSVGQGKRVEVRYQAGAVIYTDPVLLRRVLGNLVKNALEASADGDTVTVAFERLDPPAFTVHNEAVMPADVKAQVFQRSFSTKEERGRGLGTYSVLLLTTRYLGGRVSFDSEAGKGTTFRVSLPS